MKRFLTNLIMGCMAVLFVTACSADNDIVDDGAAVTDRIILDISSASLPLKQLKAVEATGAELAVSHLDVLVFEANGAFKYHERVNVAGAGKSGEVTLGVRRSRFDANAEYALYVIANSTAESAAFDDISLADLKAMKQTDRRIHLTGISGSQTEAPATFLMDGVAYKKGEQEPAEAGTVVLNNGVVADDTELSVTLRRAAAKIVVHIKKGERVEFDNSAAAADAGYYFSNMPYSTSVVSGVNAVADLRSPAIFNGEYFNWTAQEVTVTGYVYAHDWNNASIDQETRLVVNLPMTYSDGSGDPEQLPSNYYQIPVCRDKVLNRNTCYEVTVTVNTKGAENPARPIELSGVTYSVADWIEQEINVGGDDDRPVYLTVNEDSIEMRNIATDETTLRFASSSTVSARVTRVYYINKFGQETNVSNRITRQISITPDPSLSGALKVYSPVPTNNLIRYIEVTVTNEDGVERKLVIAQYPLEYITNIQAWYSYRDDFGGTTWEQVAGNAAPDGTYTTDTRINNRYSSCSWSAQYGRWVYYNSETSFFGSKVATPITSGSNRGKSTISYARWSESHMGAGKDPQPPYTYTRSKSNLDNLNNGRMYHVRITASSGNYTLGRPRMTEGVTDDGADNAKLVSPSFMIASQLGAVQTTQYKNVAAQHCAQYVEVYQDAATGKTVHLNDWRLPTAAEVSIIVRYQRSSEAMDVVLAGDQYWSASGSVATGIGSPSGKSSYIRCIRDAYETPAGK